MTAHLVVYRFDPGAAFDGSVLGAIERMELVGDAEVLGALVVARDPASGEVQAVDLEVAAGDDRFVALTDFRLSPSNRGALTERTLADHPGGVPRPVIEAIAATLEAGAAVLAALSTGGAPTVLHEALARAGGRPVADEAVDARGLPDVAERLRTATGASR